tara:strand:- start:503 stop:1198 length:696 start_codon:yes stop_codon:yes gene_type:complete
MFTQSKKDLAEIRNFLITETDFCEYEPNWFISISYLQDYSRDQLLKIHKRLDDVVRDTFDPYEMNIICIGYFLEKGKKKLVEQKHLKVLNTISDSYEYDKEMTLKDGTYGTHMVMTLSPSILDVPNKRVRKIWETMYWDFGGRPPMHLLEEENRELLLAETLEYVIRDRCPSFIANGDDSIQVDRIDDRRVFKDTGEKGWKGALHYCTKQIFCKDQFLEVFDEKNSNICVA